MTEHEDLDVFRPVGAAPQHEEVHDESDETVEACHPLSLPPGGATRTRN
jgi:hypothetical protein